MWGDVVAREVKTIVPASDIKQVAEQTPPRSGGYRVVFFSSRRRHTMCSRDWSSDVCSSDLRSSTPKTRAAARAGFQPLETTTRRGPAAKCDATFRSEERRVGKECRCGGTSWHVK